MLATVIRMLSPTTIDSFGFRLRTSIAVSLLVEGLWIDNRTAVDASWDDRPAEAANLRRGRDGDGRNSIHDPAGAIQPHGDGPSESLEVVRMKAAIEAGHAVEQLA
jgi:hypothetical protein